MASRFKNDVFPTLSPLIASFVENVESTIDVRDDMLSLDHSRHRSIHSMNTRRQASEITLLASFLRCFKGFFQPNACGRSLVDLIPAVGTMILPFLGEDNESGMACEEALEQLVRIDCDALWRPLVQLSGYAFPPVQPWRCASSAQASAYSLAEHADSHPAGGSAGLVNRARKLVALIESVPEQAL
jgi:hypothetical protein